MPAEVSIPAPETVTVTALPGTTVTVLPPDLIEAETEVAVIVTVPDKTPVSLSTLRVAVPLPLELDQLNVSATVLPATSRDIAMYDAVSMPEVIGSGPVTVTVLMVPGRTVTILLSALVGAVLDVAVMLTVPTKTPVSLSALRLAEPVPLDLVQV